MSSIVLEEYELLEDSKYRAYMSQIDKALKAFEYTTEWADLIAALEKLNKVLSAHMKYPIIPRRIVISKRLQQCMHHALPSGVHLKALVTYDLIFKCMGTNRLAQELFLYSAGLFPLLGNAAMNVRPLLLTVYETHFVPLGERLRPALNGLLAGVLQGMEEGSDHYERTNKLLESVCEASQPKIFYGSLWECIASNASVRLPAITFLLQHLDRRLPIAPDQLHLFGTDFEVVISAICRSVQDASVLVQRNALDLLVLAFPMHVNIHQTGSGGAGSPQRLLLTEEDRTELCTAAVSVLLRRDMSLNRRLYSWLLGGNVSEQQATAKQSTSAAVATHKRSDSMASSSSEYDEAALYFDHFSRSFLVQALKNVLARSLMTSPHESVAAVATTTTTDSKQLPDLKPYRLLTRLLDKAEIGPEIIEDVLLDVFRSLYHADAAFVRNGGSGNGNGNGSGKRSIELIKTANLLFETFESSFIWDFCGKVFEKASCLTYRVQDEDEGEVNGVGSSDCSTVVEMCAVIDFLLDIVSIETYVEMAIDHLPHLFKSIVQTLTAKCKNLNPNELTKALKLAKKIMSKVRPPWTAWDIHKTGGGERRGREAGASRSRTVTVSSDAAAAAATAAGGHEEVAREATESFGNSPETVKAEAAAAAAGHIDDFPEKEDEEEGEEEEENLDRQAHEILMLDCISVYQRFYVEFLKTKVFQDDFKPDKHLVRMSFGGRSCGSGSSSSSCNKKRAPGSSVSGQRSVSNGTAPPSGESGTVGVGVDDDFEEEAVVDSLRSVGVPVRTDEIFALQDAVKFCCQILVELSISIPTTTTSVSKLSRSTSSSAQGLGHAAAAVTPDKLPLWLQYLVVSSCLVDHRYADFQLQSINTVLELVDLLLAADLNMDNVGGGGGHRQPRISSEAQFSIVMLPMLKAEAFDCLFKRSVIPQVMAARLWDGLGLMSPVHHLACVSLLHHLHNVVVQPKAIERIVVKSLSYGGGEGGGGARSLLLARRQRSEGTVVDAYHKFTLFWHLSRDLSVKRPSSRGNHNGGGNQNGGRSFDLCLLKMLDNLNSLSSGPLKTLSQSWLVHAMARGDVARIMEPLLITLLDPTTARVSILYCKVEHSETVDSTHKIYAINTNSETVHHVSSNQLDCNNGNGWFNNSWQTSLNAADMQSSQNSSNRALRQYTMSSVHSGSSWMDSLKTSSTLSSSGSQRQVASSRGATTSDVGGEFSTDLPAYSVNPFALVPPELDDYESYTQGYPQATPPRSSALPTPTDGGGEGEDGEETPTTASAASSLSSPSTTRSQKEDFAGGILDNIVNHVVESKAATNGNGGGGTGSSCESLQQLTNGTSSNAKPTIHQLHSHLLLYTQVSDSKQILYTMQCIKSILQSNPRLCILMLSTTSLMSGGGGVGAGGGGGLMGGGGGGSAGGSRSHQIQTLLARHRKSVFGKGFVGELTAEHMTTHRSSTLVEVIISTCLYFLRSFYPNLGHGHLSPEEIKGNREVQLMSIDILGVLVSELILVVRDNGKAYATYISDLFARCKVQKVILHSLLSGVNDMKKRGGGNDSSTSNNQVVFTDDVLRFNEISSSSSYATGCTSASAAADQTSDRISNFSEAFQVQLLRLVLSMVILEQVIWQKKGEVGGGVAAGGGTAAAPAAGAAPHPSSSAAGESNNPKIMRYLNDRLIPDQPMFLAAIMTALRQEKIRHLHSHWTSLVTSLLPFLGKSLARTAREVTSQLCLNLERVAPFYQDNFASSVDAAAEGGEGEEGGGGGEDEDESLASQKPIGQIPADYVVTQIEALTVISHYCLLDNDSSAHQVGVSFNQAGVAGSANASSAASAAAAQPSHEILSNLLHVFMSHNGGGSVGAADAKNVIASSMESSMADAIPAARSKLLSSLPRLVSCVATLWAATAEGGGGGGVTGNGASERRQHSAPDNIRNAQFLVGAPKNVRYLLKDFLSPIAHHHSVSFLSAISVAWQERRTPNTLGMVRKPLPTCNAKQEVLVGLVGAIRTMPVDKVIQTLRSVLKSPPNVTSGKHFMVNVEVSALQFFYFYLAKCSAAQVQDCWSSLAALLRDCLALAPPAIFLALAILNQFVQQSPNTDLKMDSKKDQKELQELTGKLVDECARIGGSCLEQTTWLRPRNLAVKTTALAGGGSGAGSGGANQLAINDGDLDLNETSTKLSDLVDNEMAAAIAAAATVASSSPDLLSACTNSTKKSLAQYSVAALALLGELLASLLDIIYSSEEKDRVIPLLYNVMYNVVPYLKNHSRSNVSSFKACSKLLASLSEYQYTRKAWKKEGMELLLDTQFFQMDLQSLHHWKVTVDNLMTHDKVTFKDLMAKLSSISQSAGLSLFSSKEQELEQRALLLKRLAFVIFCSENDQYQKQMPDIQERLAESLRTIPSSPAVQGAVFLCFRVILIRMSSHHVTSLWPLIITEMVIIFSYLEQELSTDSEEWSTHLKRMSTLDSSWVVSAGSNGLAAHNSPAWLSLYLSVCKLLDLALALPAHALPQFQMYRWAFVREGGGSSGGGSSGLSPNGSLSGSSDTLLNGPNESVGGGANEAANNETSSMTSSASGVTSSGVNMQPYQQQQDFVPYVVRVAKLLISKVDDIKPVRLKRGEPTLTMTSIYTLHDLAPFFAAICNGVTRQQTKKSPNNKNNNSIHHSSNNYSVRNAANVEKASQSLSNSSDLINSIIERDFLEPIPKT